MKIIAISITCVLFLSTAILRAAPGADEASVRAAAAAAGASQPGVQTGATNAPSFGPVIEGVIGFDSPFPRHPAAFNLDTGKPVELSGNDLMNKQSLQKAGVNLYYGPVQNDVNHLTSLDLRLVPLSGPAEMRAGQGWSQEMSAANAAWENTSATAVQEEIARSSESSTAVIGTFAFSTGKNTGLLQIIGPSRPTTNSMDGLKFRYKLVKSARN